MVGNIANEMVGDAEPILCFIVGVPAIAFALVTLPGAIDFSRVAEPADGVVVDAQEYSRVTIDFETSDGERRNMTERIRGARVGDQMRVYFHPDEPWGQRTIGSPLFALVFPAGALLAGLTIVGVGVVMVQSKRKVARATRG